MRRILLVLMLVTPAAFAQGDGAALFENDIRPLLLRACGKCHGEKRQRGGLRLDSMAGILTGGERGPAVVPGDPDASLLIQAVRYGDPDFQMPPKSKLADADVATLVDWVERGAPGPAAVKEGLDPTAPFDLEARRSHWSLRPVASPDAPEVRNEDWPRTDVDRFVLARLEGAGLAPVADADPIALVRRASLVLTGLPPRPKEVEAFLADSEPGAFGRVVDRLLASPHFGERWARHWLDVVRYAESRGHEYDFDIPNAHEYRDWVIRAFNADVPYDRFVVEHIAGDLVPHPRLHPEKGFDESVLGTGFWFLGEEVHSPVDVRLDETNRQADKIDTMSKAFLGLTVACARCHDHKFDAITQNDYYAFAGFLRSSTYRQIRYETAREEAAERVRITEEQKKREPALRKALADAVREEIDGLADHLMAVREIRHEILGDAVAEPDRVIADFEQDDWSGWTVEGDAFGPRPARLDQAPPQHGIIGGRGTAAAQSAAILSGEDFRAANARKGKLISPAFTLDRDWLHFSVAGGADERTAVRLVIDGKVVEQVSGGGKARLKPVCWAVRARAGKTARLEIIDEAEDQAVAVDHVALSNSDDSEATTGRPSIDRMRRIGEAVKKTAEKRGLDEARLRRWMARCDAARDDPSDLLHEWANLKDRASTEVDLTVVEGNGVVILDAEKPESRALLDGSAWARRGRGDFILGADARRPILALATRAAWWSDPRWAAAQTAPGAQKEPGRLDWMQAGLTLRTPSFVIANGRLRYLVRGGGRAYAVLAEHRLNHAPLHGAAIRKWSGGDDWTWVEHDLTAYVGQRVQLEFTPDAAFRATPLAIAAVLDSPGPPDHPSFGWETIAFNDARAAAEHIEKRLREGGVAIESAGAKVELANRALTLLPASAISRHAVTFLAATRPRLRPSRLAPAMLDSNGVDEEFLVRGSNKSPRGPVPRRFLEVFDGEEPLVQGAGSGRLDLAARITDESNPLTARVFVNRVWHHLFGRGLVASVDDFGAMGSEPTHPELLDFLAREFMADGWSTKRLIRRLVTSRTWQLATGKPDAGDPENLLLGRARVRRLEAEAIRDSMLAVSGRLDRKLYGRPVPIKLTDFHGGRGRPKTDGPLDGGRRRSLYTAVRRNFPVPLFHAFDVPAPMHTAGARHTSNVPAQALALMNGPFVRQQAEAWARRVIPRGRTTAGRIELAFRQALGRRPSDAESERITAYVEAEAKDRGVDVKDREIWTDVCHVIFNLEEFVFLP